MIVSLEQRGGALSRSFTWPENTHWESHLGRDPRDTSLVSPPWNLSSQTLLPRVAVAALTAVGCVGLGQLLGDRFSRDNDILLALAGMVVCALYLGLTPSRAACITTVLLMSGGYSQPGFDLWPPSVQALFTLLLLGFTVDSIAKLAEHQRKMAWRSQLKGDILARLDGFQQDCTEANSAEDVENVLKATLASWPGHPQSPLTLAFSANLRQRANLALAHLRQSETISRANLLEATQRLQSALIHSLSHDLQTPLSSILGVFELLQQSPERISNQQLQELVDLGSSETERLLVQVKNLLNLGKLEGGALALNREPLDLHDRVEQVSRWFSLGDSGRFQVVCNTSQAEVDADPTLLNQIIFNLLDNALKFSPAGSPVRVELGDNWLEVQDQGFGIREDEVGQIFDRFYRGTTPVSKPGSGLGLHICKVFTDLHGGSLGWRSGPTGGSCFRLQLPNQRREVA